MKRYDHGGGWSTEAAHGKWVLYEDSRELVAALQVAHEMEVKNLKSEIDALKAELAALKAPPKVLSAEEVTEPGFYWSSCGAKSNHWVPVWVLRDRPNSLYYAFPGSAADYSLKGLKFIGPIQTPEV